MSLKGKSLSVLTPMYGGTCMNNYFNSCLTLKELFGKYEIDHSFISTVNESLVTRARNRLADVYLKEKEHTHAVYIDSDIGYNPQDILRLLELDLDIVGAPCSQKKIRWDKIQGMFHRNHRDYTADEISRAAGHPVFNPEPFEGLKEFVLTEPQEMRHVGTGLLMIRRNVFEKFMEVYSDRWYESRGSDDSDLPGQVFDFFRIGIDPETRQYDSEDYCFCQDCKALGFKVWICPWMCTTHMGSYTFTADLITATRLTGTFR